MKRNSQHLRSFIPEKLFRKNEIFFRCLAEIQIQIRFCCSSVRAHARSSMNLFFTPSLYSEICYLIIQANGNLALQEQCFHPMSRNRLLLRNKFSVVHLSFSILVSKYVNQSKIKSMNFYITVAFLSIRKKTL